jgi:hypothetical protein
MLYPWTKQNYALVPNDHRTEQKRQPFLKAFIVVLAVSCWTLIVSVASFHAGKGSVSPFGDNNIKRRLHLLNKYIAG